MKPPAERLAAILERAAGRSVPVPRALACAALDALRHGATAAAQRDATLASVRWALDNSLRDRDALAAALDEADVLEAALVRAVSDRAGSLAAVHFATVRAYLEGKGWRRRHPLRATDPSAVWTLGEHRVHPFEGEDVCVRWWDIALALAVVEGRHATLVLADWLATEMRAARGKDGPTP